jgi:hypothetical protein
MAQWIRRLPTEQEILGSSPSTDCWTKTFFPFLFLGVHAWAGCSDLHLQVGVFTGSSFPRGAQAARRSASRRRRRKKGVMRESNSRPPAPEAGIIPLDQSPSHGRRKRLARFSVQNKGRAGVEPATYRAATNCSTTELTPRSLGVRTGSPPSRATKKVCGGAGYRSLCLLHAKQALYHLSYTPWT